MMTEEPKEVSTRVAALEDAQVKLPSSQPAEEELARALALARATLESTTDGVLATDENRSVTIYNQNYVRMWKIPSDLMACRDHRQIVDFCSAQFADPAGYRMRIDEIYATAAPDCVDVLELADGRVFERHSRIQFADGWSSGRLWSFRDITERRRAETMLNDQAEWLRVTLASIGDAVLTTDAAGTVLSMNTVAQALTGWPESEAIGRQLQAVFNIVNEDDRQPADDPSRHAIREGRVVGLTNHTVLISRDGKETPIDDSAAPIRDNQGRVRGAIVVFRDILQRRKAELALRQSERELADFFENASVGLHWVGPDGRILRVNQAELSLLGYSPEEYVGRHIAEFHVDREVIDDIMRRLSAGESLRDQPARMRCKDGSIKHVLIDSSVKWQDGQFVHTRCFTRDVTDRRKGEETQARLAAIVESSDDAIVSKSIESRILSWNSAAERLFGYTAEEAIGQLINMIIPPERQSEEQTIIQRLLSGERVDHFETVRIAKSGRRIDVSLTISPIRDERGRIVGASKIARDITERRRAEDAVRRSEARFRQLADAMPQMVWTARPDGFIDYYNERWYDYTGFPRPVRRRKLETHSSSRRRSALPRPLFRLHSLGITIPDRISIPRSAKWRISLVSGSGPTRSR